jgi:DNA-binding response OmpR family regulator
MLLGGVGEAMTKILVAEDEPDIRELIGFTLRYAGFDVELTQNGAEAVEKALDVQPDLIMLDVRMPKMTGYEACKALKDNPDTDTIPVVFLSAKGQDGEIEQGLDMGALEYIVKPFAPEALITQVKRILQRAGASE